ncbi:MAG: restriction endonuclease subunit S [Hyphomonadaceae bacterium]|nr:restriction endonuclease subunit S [Hyphomonadaceae bacterium]
MVSSSGVTGRHNEAKADPPGVVTGRYGTIGEVFYVEEPYWPLNTALYVVDFKDNDPRFTAYLLRNTLRNYKSEKAAVPGVDRNVLHLIKVRTTERRRQERVVEILSAYDDLIENNRRRIALLEEAARMLYREWFVHFRFSGHEHVKIIDGLPEGWGRTTLGQVAETNRESYGAKELPEQIHYIDISSVEQGRIASKTSLSSDEAPGRARRKAKDGDVIWSNVRPNLRSYALILQPEAADVFSTGFTVLSGKGVPFSWLYLVVTTDNFVGHLVNHATGAGYPAVRPGDFERASVVLPSEGLLKDFHEASEPNFRLISKLEQQNQHLAQARDMLLPRLMNGEIAV